VRHIYVHRCIAAVFLIGASVLAYSGERIHAQESKPHDAVSVPCRADKCRMLDLWNELPKIEGDRYESVEKLRDSLFADPPGLVRSLDREQTLKELISSSERLTKIYRQMLEIERK
jgi:hypothetical protein